MNLFHTILQKVGIEKPSAPATAPDQRVDAVVTDAMAKAAADARERVAAIAKTAAEAAAHPVAPVAPAPVVAPPHPVSTVSSPTIAPAPPAFVPEPARPEPARPAPLRPAAVALVDVVSKLESLAGSHPGLDWKVSIVDLLKLLEMESSFEARKELAVELGCPAEAMSDSARMNVWLHKTVLQKIAENGGNIPESLLS